MIPLSRRLRGHQRTMTAAIGAAVFLLAIGGYALWSGASWGSYHSSYSSWKNEAKRNIDAALQLPSATSKQRDDKLQALTKATAVTTAQCAPNGVISWQENISSAYKKWRRECEATERSMNALNGQLAVVDAYLKSEHALAASLSVALAATNNKVTENAFSTVVSKWKTASTSIKGSDASPEFAPVKAKAQKAADAVLTAWQALVKAHTAKNGADYNKAIKSLSDAYSSLDGIETVSTGEFTKLADGLQAHYDAVY